ncbi:hypothetical protein Q1695_004630 [Nippostrongylus brasiliensis]|nr:hypothetical protein Q1695_004630 [Nippostrongylus brasiliensis]
MITVLLVQALLFVATNAQQYIRQCTCAEIEPCNHISSNVLLMCSDQCQSHAIAAGVSYPALRQCQQELREPMDRMISCMKASLAGSCAWDRPQMIWKTNPAAFKLAFLKRMRTMLSRSGVLVEALTFYGKAKDYLNCKTNCVSRVLNACKERNGCGTWSPPNDQLVEMYMYCAVRSGLDTMAMRRLCHCVANAGLRLIFMDVVFINNQQHDGGREAVGNLISSAPSIQCGHEIFHATYGTNDAITTKQCILPELPPREQRKNHQTTCAVQGNVCIYYENFPSIECETFNQIYDHATVSNSIFEIVNNKCGAFTRNGSIIVACFCNEDYCNAMESAKARSIRNPQITTNVFNWKVISNKELQTSLLQCLKDNMVTPSKNDDLGNAISAMIVLAYFFCAILSCVCVVAIYRGPAETQKQVDARK